MSPAADPGSLCAAETETATTLSTKSPTAPPILRIALVRALATPVSSAATPSRIALVIVVRAAPIPRPIASWAGSTSVQIPLSGVTVARQARPAVPRGPEIMIVLGLTQVMILPAPKEPTRTPIPLGMKARPVISGEYPRTICR
ncbi:hypothetical protein GCM10027590_58000 [Nocardiopsis nanhaiensis]